jgi:hypothetical protein
VKSPSIPADVIHASSARSCSLVIIATRSTEMLGRE